MLGSKTVGLIAALTLAPLPALAWDLKCEPDHCLTTHVWAINNGDRIHLDALVGRTTAQAALASDKMRPSQLDRSRHITVSIRVDGVELSPKTMLEIDKGFSVQLDRKDLEIIAHGKEMTIIGPRIAYTIPLEGAAAALRRAAKASSVLTPISASIVDRTPA